MENLGQQLTSLMDEKNWQPTFKKLMQQAFSDSDVQSFLEENEDSLTKENILRSSANIYEFVQEKNKIENNQSGIAPGYYPKLVINKHHIDVTYLPTEQTKTAWVEQEKKQRVSKYNMPKDIEDVSLSDIDPTKDREAVLRFIYDFIQQYIDNPTDFHEGLYLYGPFGVGKTYILGALANELAEHGYESMLVHFPSFSFDVKQSIGENRTGEIIEPLKLAPILVIDDIGADSMSSWLRDDVLGVILQYRMQEHLPTFFTSNFSMDQLENHLTYSQRGESEPLKAKRIMERVHFLTKEMELTGTNRRQSS